LPTFAHSQSIGSGMKYPLGIQTFSKIIEDDMLYIDKTAIIYDLIQQGSVYFLSRPRRFGKSLLISTLESLFSGHKSLFNGLAIADTDYDFAIHPVITIEFAKEEFGTADNLRSFICGALDYYAEQYDISLVRETYAQRFDELVTKLHEKTGQKVVLLVDEYDKPILNNLKKPILWEIKEVMAAFYSVAKALDKHLKFVFITGVSKFAKISVFSGMNSLTDISLNRDYATLCGITQQELEHHFAKPIATQAELEQLDKEAMLSKIKFWYNGYQFHHQAPGVYNPFSLLSLFRHKEFKNHWFTTATPTFLMDLLKDKVYELKNLSQFEMGESGFAVAEPEDMEVQSLFVQTGYLTIKSYNAPLYTLDFPNYEVKKSFYESVVAHYSHLNAGPGETYIHRLTQHLNAGNMDDFFETLEHFFTKIPYDITLAQEKYYQSLFYAIFSLIGLNIEAEVRTNKGRIDCVIQTEKAIYIIEFKLNDSCEAALKQIQDKQYAQKYLDSGKEIVLLGVGFDQQTRNIGGFVSESI
jgi:hypothetical protein